MKEIIAQKKRKSNLTIMIGGVLQWTKQSVQLNTYISCQFFLIGNNKNRKHHLYFCYKKKKVVAYYSSTEYDSHDSVE